MRPIGKGNGCVKEKRAHHVGYSSNDSFSLAILLGSIGARQPIGDPICGEESVKVFVIKFTAIVTLETFDRCLKLCFDVSMEVDKDRKHLRLEMQRENP